MSEMKDMFGDTIYIETEPGLVTITFVLSSGFDAVMHLEAGQTRMLIKKLKKALDEMEDM